MVQVKEVNGHFGISDNGIVVVPCTYETEIGAIEEWVYFEKINVVEHFLPHTRTIEEIDNIINKLNKK